MHVCDVSGFTHIRRAYNAWFVIHGSVHGSYVRARVVAMCEHSILMCSAHMTHIQVCMNTKNEKKDIETGESETKSEEQK